MLYAVGFVQLQIDYMDSHVIAEYAGDDDRPQKSCSDQKQQVLGQPTIAPRASVLCFSCAQPQWESDWNFSIEDLIPIDNSKSTLSSFKTADLMKEKEIEKGGKSQKMRKKMGRVVYHRPPRALLSAKRVKHPAVFFPGFFLGFGCIV